MDTVHIINAFSMAFLELKMSVDDLGDEFVPWLMVEGEMVDGWGPNKLRVAPSPIWRSVCASSVHSETTQTHVEHSSNKTARSWQTIHAHSKVSRASAMPTWSPKREVEGSDALGIMSDIRAIGESEGYWKA
jgi:hypothetical protein